MEKNIAKLARVIADDFLNFVNKGVSPYHVVQESSERLTSAGFQEISEADNWNLKKGGKYFFTRNKTTLVAFHVGEQWDANNTGFKIIGAHTDSPCLRLAPLSTLSNNEIIQTHVCTYGGGLWHTWFDRDLTLAGRVTYKSENGQYTQKLFYYPKALMKVPNLAIHLVPAGEREKFGFNNETHLRPIFASEAYNALTGEQPTELPKEGFQVKNHYAGLLNLIAKETQLKVEDIADLDLYFCDTQPAGYFGLNQEFISSPRLDNLFSSFHAVKALINPESFDKSSTFINMICLFDHEECGSESYQGAASSLLNQNIERIWKLLAQSQENVLTDSLFKTYNNSFLISADMAHGIHPNYAEKHKGNHQIKMNRGVAIKINHNQRYTSDAVGQSILKIICQQCDVPLQEFAIKNDSPCGSTIGPLISSKTGVKAVDVGVSQLGMHSIRETCGVIDSYYYERFMSNFFKLYDKIPQDLSKF